MKIQLLSLVISLSLLTTLSSAQNYSGIRPSIDSIFSELDRQFITTGILVDKTAQFSDLNAFNGIDDSITDLFCPAFDTTYYEILY